MSMPSLTYDVLPPSEVLAPAEVLPPAEVPLVARARPATWWSCLADYVELTKPRIATLVLVTVAVSSALAAGQAPSAALLLPTLLGTALVAASASAFNQWLERGADARMPRTADRPLPSGRLASWQVIAFGVVTISSGLAYLAIAVNWLTALMGFLTWLCYVCIYTPLKSRTPSNTAVGAVAGALPVFIGWTAVGAPLDTKAFGLFLLVYLWQFPHFMAIAWIYRAQYAAAGMKMLTVVDPSGRRPGAQAVVSALAILPVSLVSVLHTHFGLWFGGLLLALGAAQLACAVMFLASPDRRTARRLLRASLVYLPVTLALLTVGPIAAWHW